MTAYVSATLDRRFQPLGSAARDEGRKRFPAENELSRAEPEHDQGIGRARSRDQRHVIDVLQVSAPGAQYGRACVGLALNRGVFGRYAHALARTGDVCGAGRDIQVVDDCADHIGVLDRSGDPMAVIDEESKAEHDEHPTRDEGDLGDERRACILVRDEEDQANVHERAHERADGDLGDPVLQEAVEQARSEQRRDHR